MKKKTHKSVLRIVTNRENLSDLSTDWIRKREWSSAGCITETLGLTIQAMVEVNGNSGILELKTEIMALYMHPGWRNQQDIQTEMPNN